MDANTPIFRGALSIGLLWLVAYGYFSINQYWGIIDRLEQSRYVLPERMTEKCYIKKIDYSKQIWTDRDPTSQEIQSCLDSEIKIYIGIVESSEKSEIENFWENFALFGAMPVIFLLGGVIFWRNIARIFLRIGRAYVKWLRFGVSSSPGKSKEKL